MEDFSVIGLVYRGQHFGPSLGSVTKTTACPISYGEVVECPHNRD